MHQAAAQRRSPRASPLPAASPSEQRWGEQACEECGISFRKKPFMELSYHYQRISGSFQCPLDPSVPSNKT